MEETTLFARKIETDGTVKKQPLEEHLKNVSMLCAEHAAVFGGQAWGKIIGYLHDIGKAQREFQEKLDGKKIQVEHSGAGAALISELAKKYDPLMQIGSFAVAGHHGGLPDVVHLEERIEKNKPILSKIDEWGNFEPDEKLSVPPQLQGKLDEMKRRSLEFWGRFLFSCLVDADRLDAERFDLKAKLPEGTEVESLRGRYSSIADLQDRLDAFIDGKVAKLGEKQKKSRINKTRAEILKVCREAAKNERGFFTLCVPTGGGKTLAGMSFALNHAREKGLRRVICVIPYTSIIEQNAQVYREALGDENVLEHHCNYDPIERLGSGKVQNEETADRFEKASENWDFPIIVTTTVQFFESLFANGATRCRKLHNIAGSVIVLDEAQTLPINLLDPILEGMRELVDNYGCSIVISTATQPALEKRHNMEKGLDGQKVRHIISDPQTLYRSLARVRYHWPEPDEYLKDWAELAERALRHRRVLLVTHKRTDARDLTRELQRLAPEATLFHLSAQMCPAHRLDTINEIRKILQDPNRECRVVSTQLIEAGVDLDFDAVFRALGGLDSIVQAAGRCNREGRDELGDVYLYQFTKPPKGVPEKALDACKTMLQSARNENLELDLENIETFKDYFRRLYRIRKSDDISLQRTKFNYETVDSLFKIIEDDERVSVIVPYGDWHKHVEAIRSNGWSKEEGRKLQRFIVQIPQRNLANMPTQLDPITENVNLYLLPEICKTPYDHLFGLLPSEEISIDANRFII